MTELSDAVVLCKYDSARVKAYDGFLEDLVVLTANQRITVYNVEDCQMLCSWFVKSGQKLTCAAVQMPSSQQFAVILDNSIIQLWNKNDSSIDQKSQKIKLSKPAHQLFPVNNRSCFILNDDSTAAFSSDPSTFFGTANKYHSLAWCGTYTLDAGSGVVAVFEAGNSERHVIGYSLSAGDESIQSVDLRVLPSTSDSLVVGYCLQSDKDLHLITLFKNGRVTRTTLMRGSSQFSLENSLDFYLDPVDSQSKYVDLVALDDLQIATVRQNQTAAYVEVWDVKYQGKHSELRVDLSHLGDVQHLRLNAKVLVLTCDKGACTISYQLRRVTLLRAMSCRNASPAKLMKKCEVTGMLQKDLVTTLSKLSDPSQTPAYASFRKEFSKLDSWMQTCEDKPEVGFFALPLVDFIIRRICHDSKTLWPVDELKRLVKAGLLSSSLCQSLFESIGQHLQFDLLLLCLTSVRDIPESAIVVSLECILRKENADVIKKFNCSKEQLLNLLLCLPYNECFLMEFIWRLEFSLVVELVQYFYGLWNSDKVSNLQICSWMSVLLGSHMQQFNMFSECDSLLSNFIEKVNDEISKWLKLNVGSEVKLDEAKLKAIQQKSHQHHRYYITSFVHPFDD